MEILKPMIDYLHRKVQGSPRLYEFAYGAATLNLDRLHDLPARHRFPSRFGGLWTDRDDFEAQLALRRLEPDEEARLRRWRENGFIILEGAIPHEVVDVLVDELQRLPDVSPARVLVTDNAHHRGLAYERRLLRPHQGRRIVDYYFYSKVARDVLFHPAITRFLKRIFDREPLLTQSLSFEHGSEQEIHQDPAFVIMNSPMRFAASWTALEEVRAGSGELVYYPGSHLWGDFLFSGRFKHFDQDGDGEPQLVAWRNWMHDEATRRGVRLAHFRARKGDVLIWHPGLAHGGAPIADDRLTRRSLVGHYCPIGVRPLYHYYKPAQRTIHVVDGNRFSSSHYR